MLRPNDILVKTRKSDTFGDKSLAALEPKIWNALPQNTKAGNTYVKFRNILQHGLDLNANVTHAVLITVKQSHYQTNSKYFHAST